MTPRSSRRILLEPSADVTDVMLACEKLGMVPKAFFGPDGDQPYEILMHDEDKRSAVHYIENDQLGVRYLEVEGDDVERVVRELEHRLAHRSADQALDRAAAATDVEERILGLYDVALTVSRHPKDRVRDLLERSARDPEARIRGATILACAYTEWPDLRSVLEPMAQNDADPANRADAALLLSRLP